LQVDAGREVFANDKSANEMLTREYRKPFTGSAP